jgi:hypothetical protein
MNISETIASLLEKGELSFDKKHQNYENNKIIIEKKSMMKDGYDGYLIEIYSVSDTLFKLIYDSWNRIFIRIHPYTL